MHVIGMHFMNPVPVMELVEVIRGLATSDSTAAAVIALAKRVGKTPVEVQDYPGFVANRMLMPMINEAVYCVMEGVATPEAIDTVMKLGMNHPMGPLALADLIGLDTCLAILDVLHAGLGRPEVPRMPVAPEIRGGGLAWAKDQAGVPFVPLKSGRLVVPEFLPLTDQQREIQALARSFAAEELAPHAAEWDRTSHFDRSLLPRLAELGFLGMLVPESEDGLGLDTMTYLLVLEEIAAVDASTAVLLSVHNSLPSQMSCGMATRRSASGSYGPWPAASCLARLRCRSPTPGRTRRRSRRRPCATGMGTCSMARRPG